MRDQLLALIVLVILIAGCVGDPQEKGRAVAPERPIVVAVIDSGSNPYLSVFESPLDPQLVELPAVTPVPISTTGSVATRYEMDRPLLDTLQPETLYHFESTRLLAISFRYDLENYPATFDANRHGVATSYLVAREAPSAVIVAVQVSPRLCATEGDTACTMDPSVATAMEWVAAQDWIDVVSISMGPIAGMPDRPEAHPEMERFLAASEAAAANGKLIVNAAGNTPTPTTGDHFSSPPWIICVGGADIRRHGASVMSAKLVDVVANFSEFAPLDETGTMGDRVGTSMSAPVVAGTLAHALQHVRLHRPDHNAGDLRHALNVSSILFRAEDWSPETADLSLVSLPVLVQPQMGWGYVNGSLAPEVARRVIEQDFSIPPGKEQAALFQPRWQEAREEFWARYS